MKLRRFVAIMLGFRPDKPRGVGGYLGNGKPPKRYVYWDLETDEEEEA